MNTVSASYLANIVDSCVEQGAAKAVLLNALPKGGQSLGLANGSSSGTSGKAGRVSVESVFLALHKTVELTGKAEIGLMCGENLRPSSLNEIGNAILCCASLRQAILMNRKYQALTQQLGRTNLKINGDQARLLWEPYYKDPEYGRMVTDLVMAGHAIFGRWLSWVHDKKINAVHFRHAKPTYADAYIKIFDCPVLFGQGENAMLIDVDAIDAPLPQANAVMLAEICGRLDIALARLQADKSYSRMVAEALQINTENGLLKLPQIAKHLGVSSRSLRRSLTDEQTSFRQILEKTRQQLCEKWLSEGKTLLLIAEDLGYSQQSSFNRAFKGWFGTTPKVYLRAQKTANAAFDQLAP